MKVCEDERVLRGIGDAGGRARRAAVTSPGLGSLGDAPYVLNSRSPACDLDRRWKLKQRVRSLESRDQESSRFEWYFSILMFMTALQVSRARDSFFQLHLISFVKCRSWTCEPIPCAG